MMKALQLILALVLLVTIHEFGHYIFARIFGIKVNRFYLFFNPWFSLLKYYPSEGKLEVIGWTTPIKDVKGEVTGETPHALLTLKVGKPRPTVGKNGRPTWAATMYGLGWLPLGGYCDIAGMVDETKGADKLESTPQPWEFRSKGAWKRFMVMVAGVLFNFLLAIVIYAGIAFHWGDRAVPYAEAYEGMQFMEPLVDAGLRNGDILLAVDGQAPDIRNNMLGWELVQPGTKVTVLRNHADTVTVTMPADMLERLAQMDIKKAKNMPIMMPRVPVYVDMVQGGSPAAQAGVANGDRIVKVGNDTTPSLNEFFEALALYKEQTIPMTVVRDGREKVIDITPNSDAKIGIQLRPITKIYPVEEVRYSLLESLPRGWEIGTGQLASYVSSLRMLFTKSGAQQIGGFGTLGQLFPEKWDWYSFWQITAFLSVILAFMNIIPIPGLDGGHVLFLLTEMVSGRKPSDKFQEVANTVGFALLLLLLIYANGMDIVRFLR